MKDVLGVILLVAAILTGIGVACVWVKQTMRPCDVPTARIEYILPLRPLGCWLSEAP